MSDKVLNVKCIDSVRIDKSLTQGKIYKSIKEIGDYYLIEKNDNGIQYEEYLKRRFEIVDKDYYIKEYTLQEIFNLPEGIEFINADAHFEVKDGTLYNWFKPKDKQSVRLTKMYVNMKFIKVENPVGFIEAITSGKRIKVDVDGLDKKYNKTILNEYWNNIYHPIKDILEMLARSNEKLRNVIISEGKWYIEKSEDDN